MLLQKRTIIPSVALWKKLKNSLYSFVRKAFMLYTIVTER